MRCNRRGPTLRLRKPLKTVDRCGKATVRDRPMTGPRRLSSPPRLPGSAAAEGAGGRDPGRGGGSAAVRAHHAAHGQAILGAHDQLRAAGLGVRQDRGLPLPGHPSGNRAGLGLPCPRCSSTSGWMSPATRSRPRPASSTSMRRRRRWVPTETRTSRIQRRRWSRSRWVTMQPSTSEAFSARGPKQRLLLKSGDVVVLGGAARMAYHGVDRIHPGTSSLLPEGGRLNLTLRRVTAGKG